MRHAISRIAIVAVLLLVTFAMSNKSTIFRVIGITGYAVAQDQEKQFVTGLNNAFSGKDFTRPDLTHGWVFIVLIFGSGMIVAILIGMLAYFIRSLRQSNEDKINSAGLFLENSTRYGLSSEEHELLNSLIAHEKVIAPHTIFQSLELFEKCVEAHVNYLMRNNSDISPDGKEGKLISDLRRKLGYSHLPLEHPLVSTRNIAIGQNGSLFGKDGSKPIFNKVSVVDNNCFYFSIQYDVEREDVYRIETGSIVRFIFARQSDGLYGVQVRVANVKEPGAIDFLHTMEIKRNQLRQHVRIEAGLPLKFRLLSTKDPDSSEIKRGQVVTTRMSDISGGGLSFTNETALRLNDLISINFDLPGVSFAGVTGKIVHLTLKESRGQSFIKHHVQFVNIEQRKREQIIKYVFEKERHLSQWR